MDDRFDTSTSLLIIGGQKVFVMVAKCRQEFRDVVVVEAVDRLPSHPVDGHKFRVSEQAQLMGSGRWGEPGHIREFVDRSRSIEHRPKDLQPAVAGEHLHGARKFNGFGVIERPLRRRMFRWFGHGCHATASYANRGG